MKINNLLKFKPKNLINSIKSISSYKNSLFVVYNDNTHNWGDALNEYLVKNISGKTPYSTISTMKLPKRKSYTVIGSVLSFHNLNNIEVWGTGLISGNVSINGKPSKIHALRGPLTAKKLKSINIESPNIFGDPAILLPLFYKPKKIRKYKLGIILHKLDREDEKFDELLNTEGVLNIDIYSETTQFIDQVNSCEVVASSSLHGLIAADSYSIPRVWLHGKALEKHGRFKFDDYFLGMNFNDKIVPYDKSLKTENVIDHSDKYSHSPQIISKLLDSCPFKKPSL